MVKNTLISRSIMKQSGEMKNISDSSNLLLIQRKKPSNEENLNFVDFKAPWVNRKVGTLYLNRKRYYIYWGSNTIGKSRNTSIPIKSKKISGRQAVIVATDNTILLRSLSEKFPTVLNGETLRSDKWYKVRDLTSVEFGELRGYIQSKKSSIAIHSLTNKMKINNGSNKFILLEGRIKEDSKEYVV